MEDVAEAEDAEVCCGIRNGDKPNDGMNDRVNNNEHGDGHDRQDADVAADAVALKGVGVTVDGVALADAVAAGPSLIVRQTGPGIC